MEDLPADMKLSAGTDNSGKQESEVTSVGGKKVKRQAAGKVKRKPSPSVLQNEKEMPMSLDEDKTVPSAKTAGKKISKKQNKDVNGRKAKKTSIGTTAGAAEQNQESLLSPSRRSPQLDASQHFSETKLPVSQQPNTAAEKQPSPMATTTEAVRKKKPVANERKTKVSSKEIKETPSAKKKARVSAATKQSLASKRKPSVKFSHKNKQTVKKKEGSKTTAGKRKSTLKASPQKKKRKASQQNKAASKSKRGKKLTAK